MQPLRRSSFLALCACFVFMHGCGQQNEPLDLTIAHEVSPQPPRAGEVTITLRVTDTSGTPVRGARITLAANMSHPGMTPVVSEATESEPGRYRAIMGLTMAGDWIVLVHLALPNGVKVDRHFEIQGVAST